MQDIIDRLVKDILFKSNIANPETFEFRVFLKKISEDYLNDGEFIDAMKNANGEIEKIKEFIRKILVKDPNIYNINEL